MDNDRRIAGDRRKHMSPAIGEFALSERAELLATIERQKVEFLEAAESNLLQRKTIRRLQDEIKELRERPLCIPDEFEVRMISDGGVRGFIIGSPRVNGVRHNTSAWFDDEDPAHSLLARMLVQMSKEV